MSNNYGSSSIIMLLLMSKLVCVECKGYFNFFKTLSRVFFPDGHVSHKFLIKNSHLYILYIDDSILSLQSVS